MSLSARIDGEERPEDLSYEGGYDESVLGRRSLNRSREDVSYDSKSSSRGSLESYTSLN